MNREAANPPATAQMRQTSDETPAPAAPRGRLARKYALLLIGLIGVALVLNSGFTKVGKSRAPGSPPQLSGIGS